MRRSSNPLDRQHNIIQTERTRTPDERTLRPKSKHIDVRSFSCVRVGLSSNSRTKFPFFRLNFVLLTVQTSTFLTDIQKLLLEIRFHLTSVDENEPFGVDGMDFGSEVGLSFGLALVAAPN